MTPRIMEVEAPAKPRVKVANYVFEAKWSIEVEGEEQFVTQLVSGRDFQAAFFKARNWAKSNCTGRLVSMTQRSDMVI